MEWRKHSTAIAGKNYDQKNQTAVAKTIIWKNTRKNFRIGWTAELCCCDSTLSVRHPGNSDAVVPAAANKARLAPRRSAAIVDGTTARKKSSRAVFNQFRRPSETVSLPSRVVVPSNSPAEPTPRPEAALEA